MITFDHAADKLRGDLIKKYILMKLVKINIVIDYLLGYHENNNGCKS